MSLSSYEHLPQYHKSSKDASSFKYAPLRYEEDEIRLLQVNLEDELSYSLKSHVSLRKSKPQYTALSYTWGNQRQQKTIYVGGKSLLISSNLYQALKEVRAFWTATHALHGKQLALWVDQICIDQTDDEEKNHQVAFMRMIYDRAEEVLIWLPVSPPLSPFNPGSVEHAKNYKFNQANCSDWDAWRKWVDSILAVSGDDNTANYRRQAPMAYKNAPEAYRSPPGDQDLLSNIVGAWTDICAILQSPWWRRTWVYQEFVLATRANFLIEGFSVPWKELYELLNPLMSQSGAQKALWAGSFNEIERQAGEFSSKLNDSEKKIADLDQRAEDDGFCRIDWSESCSSFHEHSKKWLKFNNNLARWPCACYCETVVEDWTWDCWDSDFWFSTCLSPLWTSLLVVGVAATSALYIPSGGLAGLSYALSSCSWRCDPRQCGWWRCGYKRPIVVERDSTALEMKDLQRICGDLATRQKAVELLRQRVTEADQAWELTKSLFRSKINMAPSNEFVPLSQLVAIARNSLCSDHRDKIFAFLGLTHGSYELQANYERDNTFDKVLISAVVAIIRVEENLNVLSLATEDRDLRDASSSLPGWVPWLSEPHDGRSEHNRFLRDVRFPLDICKASKEKCCMVSFLSDKEGNPNRILKARGIRVDRLLRFVEDPPRELWRRFSGQTTLQFTTRNTARLGDEIWVLFGLDLPLTLSRLNKADGFYTIVGPAMIREHDDISDILKGSLIDKLEEGQVSAEDICIV